jgi:hypothetical protein
VPHGAGAERRRSEELTMRILVAEDETIIRLDLREILERGLRGGREAR